jgi:hypothetical protein
MRHKARMASAAALQICDRAAEGAPIAHAPEPARLRLSDFPIPANVEPDDSWPQQMVEIAGQIGARAALLFCEAFGGKSVYVPQRCTPVAGQHLIQAIGQRATLSLIGAYGGTRLAVPKAGAAIARARRRSVLAHVRAGTFNVSTAATILGVTRNYAGWLVNHSGEAAGIDPEPLPLPREQRLVSAVAALVSKRLRAAGIGSDVVQDVMRGVTVHGIGADRGTAQFDCLEFDLSRGSLRHA